MFLEHLHKPSIRGADLQDAGAAEPIDVASCAVYLVKPDWTGPYLDFLTTKKLPDDDEVLKRQIVRHAKAFTIINGELYKHSTSDIYQRCITPEEGRNLLDEIHAGVSVIMLPPGLLCQKLSGKGFIG